MDSPDLLRTRVVDVNAGTHALEAALLLVAARSSLQDALREEGEALVGACDAVNAKGAGSIEATLALRSAQSAHSRTGLADSAVRALILRSDHAEAVKDEAGLPPAPPTPVQDGVSWRGPAAGGDRIPSSPPRSTRTCAVPGRGDPAP